MWLAGVAVSNSSNTFVATGDRGQERLAQVSCVVRPGFPELVLPGDDEFLENEIRRNLQCLNLSLPSKRIVVNLKEPRSDGITKASHLAYHMVVLAAIGAIPKDQVEHAVFNASVQSGELKTTNLDQLKVSVLAAEANLEHWCCADDAEIGGAVGNCCTYQPETLHQVLDHCLGRRLVEPRNTRLTNPNDIHSFRDLDRDQTTHSKSGCPPIFEIGGVTCTLRDGQVFALQLGQFEDF